MVVPDDGALMGIGEEEGGLLFYFLRRNCYLKRRERKYLATEDAYRYVPSSCYASACRKLVDIATGMLYIIHIPAT